MLAPVLRARPGRSSTAQRDFELLREHGDGLAGLGDAFAMGLGFLGRAVDLGGAVADRDDETAMRWRRCRTSRRWSAFCSATAPLTFSNTGRIASIACEMRCTASTEPAASFCSASIFLRDLFGGVLGLHRERLDLGGDHGKAAPGGAGARRLDGGVERQQRGLPGDLRDQVDDVADRGRGLRAADRH